jgi:hypothetical protein
MQNYKRNWRTSPGWCFEFIAVRFTDCHKAIWLAAVWPKWFHICTIQCVITSHRHIVTIVHVSCKMQDARDLRTCNPDTSQSGTYTSYLCVRSITDILRSPFTLPFICLFKSPVIVPLTLHDIWNERSKEADNILWWDSCVTNLKNIFWSNFFEHW